MFQRGDDQVSTLRSGNRFRRRSRPVSPDPDYEFRVSERIKDLPDINSTGDLFFQFLYQVLGSEGKISDAAHKQQEKLEEQPEVNGK